jgi:hypothetical protein
MSYKVSRATEFTDLSSSSKTLQAKKQLIARPKTTYIGLEKEIDQYRINRVRREVSAIIGVAKNKEEEEHKPELRPSLSAYSQQKAAH